LIFVDLYQFIDRLTTTPRPLPYIWERKDRVQLGEAPAGC